MDADARDPVRLSVVIPTWHGAALVIEAVRGLDRAGRPDDVELIVVDDGSGDDTADRLRAAGLHATVLAHDVNRGFGAAVNTGFRAATGRFLATVNNDAVVSWATLDRIAGVVEARSRAAAGAPSIVDAHGRAQRVGFDLPAVPWRRARGSRPVAAQPWSAGYLRGACVVFARAALEEVGLFDEQYVMFAEEIDLFRRLADAGWSSWVVPVVQATHQAGQTTRNHPDLALAAGYRRRSYRSMALYYRKHHPGVGGLALRAILAIRLAGRLARAALAPPARWREPRGASELLDCLREVATVGPSRPVEPRLSPAGAVTPEPSGYNPRDEPLTS